MKKLLSTIMMTAAASAALASVHNGSEVYQQVSDYSSITMKSPAVTDLKHLSEDIKHLRMISALDELNSIVQSAQTGFLPYKASYNKVKFSIGHINNSIQGLIAALQTQNFVEVPVLTQAIESDFNTIWNERSNMWQNGNYINDMSNYFIVEGIAAINKQQDKDAAIKSWAMLNQLAYNYPQQLFMMINKIIDGTKSIVNITDDQLNSVIGSLQANPKFQQLALVSAKSRDIAKQVSQINEQIQNAKLFNKHIFNDKMREVMAQVDQTVQSASDRVQVIDFMVSGDVTNYQIVVDSAEQGNEVAKLTVLASEALSEKTGQSATQSYHEILYVLASLTKTVVNQ
ncbi:MULTISPECIES: hypothetical protein [Cysteiniphilum]|uniref:Uncharacterized protein n=1 Tax=Cysteiniphilum litorale TaxID=2056700 RepID=A0A8J2Z6V6_9GAMM|nr:MULTISPECIES: hypothetical protein [Cysteiniphilum]GGG07235.1 hypothetical protein GCM10010995_25960 [Cysteiniphilum litorale]